MSNQCKKKQRNTSPLQKKLNILSTMRRKQANLTKIVSANPTDLSAKNALAQVNHDLKNWKG